MIAALLLIVTCVSATKYDDTVDKINKIVDDNPVYAQLIDIGTNDQGDTIYGLRLENPNYQLENRSKPNQLLVGVHHGNEANSADLALLFATDLIARFKNSSSTDYAALSGSVYYVVPVLNISGYNNNNRREKNKSGSWIDANRDYPDPCVQNSYFQLASTQNLANFIERNNVVGSVTAHGYVGTFTYPWGIYTSNTKTLDDALYKSMAQESVKSNNYGIGTHADVIYPASGAYEDWAYHQHGVWTMLIELKYSSGDLSKDSSCLIKFFALVPDTRSTQHQHSAGNCRSSRDSGESRP